MLVYLYIGHCKTPDEENRPKNLGVLCRWRFQLDFYLIIYFCWIQSLKAMWDNTLCAIIYECNNQPESYILQHSVP